MSGSILLILIFIFIFVFFFIIPRYFPKIWNAESTEVFMPSPCKINKSEFNKHPESFIPKGFLEQIGKCEGCDESGDNVNIVEAYLFYELDHSTTTSFNNTTITTNWNYIKTPKKYYVCADCTGVCTAKELLSRDLSRLGLYQDFSLSGTTAGFQARSYLEIKNLMENPYSEF